MSILIFKDNQQFGPFDEAQVREYIQNNQFTLQDLAWKDGQTEWVPLAILLNENPPLHALNNNPIVERALNQASIKKNSLWGLSFWGWLSFILVILIMYFSIWTFFLYVPLYVISLVLAIVILTKKNYKIGVPLLIATVIIPPYLGFYLFTSRTTEAVAKAFGIELNDSNKTVNKTKPNDVLDEKNGFRDFKLGASHSEISHLLKDKKETSLSKEDTDVYYAKDEKIKVGTVELFYIALEFKHNILVKISVGVDGTTNTLGFKESLMSAYGQPNEISSNTERLKWVGNHAKLDFFQTTSLRRVSGNAHFTNSDVDNKISELIQNKAKEAAVEGAKSL